MTETSPIRILIADDHAVVREGTRQILEQEPDLEVVAEAGDGEADGVGACGSVVIDWVLLYACTAVAEGPGPGGYVTG